MIQTKFTLPQGVTLNAACIEVQEITLNTVTAKLNSETFSKDGKQINSSAEDEQTSISSIEFTSFAWADVNAKTSNKPHFDLGSTVIDFSDCEDIANYYDALNPSIPEIQRLIQTCEHYIKTKMVG